MIIKITKDEFVFPTLGKEFKQAVGVSVAANMREALKEYDASADEVVVYVDTPVVLMLENQLEEENPEQLYKLTVTNEGEEIVVLKNEFSEFNVSVLFSVSKDLMTVIEDNFQQFEIKHILTEKFGEAKVSDYKEKTLYAFFYDKTMYAYAFKQGRLAFFNEFEANEAQNCVFLLLSVYKQLNYSQLKDEIILEGDVAFKDELKDLLSEFVKNVTV